MFPFIFFFQTCFGDFFELKWFLDVFGHFLEAKVDSFFAKAEKRLFLLGCRLAELRGLWAVLSEAPMVPVLPRGKGRERKGGRGPEAFF